MSDPADPAQIIAASPLFDAAWYLHRYPQVARSGLSAARHYLWVGARAGWHPGPQFDTQAYLARYPQVVGAGAEGAMNPLVHYETIGRAIGHTITAADPALMPLDTQPAAKATAARDQHPLWAELQSMVDGHTPGLGFTRSTGRAADLARGDYTVVTPTGDRPAFFNRCMHMVATQTVPPAQWVVVDDGQVPLDAQMVLPDWITYVRRTRAPDDPPHTLPVNMLAALDHIAHDRVLVMEDDDWYAPQYAHYMLPHLDHADLIGLNQIRYYHLQAGLWKTATPPRHTAFAQCGFRRGHAWDHLAAVCCSNFTEIREKGVIDRHWWHTFEGKSRLIDPHPCLHLGIKGAFGRAGLAHGHGAAEVDYIPDPDHAYLRQCIGPDHAFYAHWQRRAHKPYVLYTLHVPEQPLPDLAGHDLRQFDLFAFSRDPLPKDSPWQALPFDLHGNEDQTDPHVLLARVRALPHLYFPQHGRSLWLAPGAKVPSDPAGLMARSIERGCAIGAYGRDPERGYTGSNMTYKRYLTQCERGQAQGLRADVLLRAHSDPQVAAAMVSWQQTQSGTDWLDADAGLSLAVSSARLETDIWD